MATAPMDSALPAVLSQGTVHSQSRDHMADHGKLRVCPTACRTRQARVRFTLLHIVVERSGQLQVDANRSGHLLRSGRHPGQVGVSELPGLRVR